MMTSDRFQGEVDFGVAMLLVREMLTAKLITQLEFAKIEKMYKAKYKPVFQGFSSLENRNKP
jgi:hypothetical protein